MVLPTTHTGAYVAEALASPPGIPDGAMMLASEPSVRSLCPGALGQAAENCCNRDLVISDLMMPEMGGREFVDRFAATRPDTSVLFMSGYTDDDGQQRGRFAEHRAFIERPFTVDQITRKVREVLDQA